MFGGLFDRLVQSHITTGSLTLIRPGGGRREYGDGSGPAVVVELAAGVAARLMLQPSLALGEGFTNGDIRILEGSIYNLLDLIGRSFQDVPSSGPFQML